MARPSAARSATRLQPTVPRLHQSDAPPPRGGRVVLIAVLLAFVALFGAAIIGSFAWDGKPNPHGFGIQAVPTRP